MSVKYDIRHDPRNDSIGKGYQLVATDVNGIENVVCFKETRAQCEAELSLIQGDTVDKPDEPATDPEPELDPETATGKDGGRKRSKRL